jgi:hypothetical protein
MGAVTAGAEAKFGAHGTEPRIASSEASRHVSKGEPAGGSQPEAAPGAAKPATQPQKTAGESNPAAETIAPTPPPSAPVKDQSPSASQGPGSGIEPPSGIVGGSAKSKSTAASSESPAENVPKPKKGKITAANVNRVAGMRTFLTRLEQKGLTLNELNLTPEKVIEMLNKDPDAGMKNLNQRVDIAVEHRRQQLGSAEEKVDTPHEVGGAEKKWTREEVLGDTPGKSSATGRKVIARMRSQKKITGPPGQEMVYHEPTKQWYPIDQCDMGHTHDAVTWWNREGYFYSPKSAKIRAWMLEADNYELEPRRINTGRGAALGHEEQYRAPHPDPITPEETEGVPKQRATEEE